jgi:hypothetical protein
MHTQSVHFHVLKAVVVLGLLAYCVWHFWMSWHRDRVCVGLIDWYPNVSSSAKFLSCREGGQRGREGGERGRGEREGRASVTGMLPEKKFSKKIYNHFLCAWKFQMLNIHPQGSAFEIFQSEATVDQKCWGLAFSPGGAVDQKCWGLALSPGGTVDQKCWGLALFPGGAVDQKCWGLALSPATVDQKCWGLALSPGGTVDQKFWGLALSQGATVDQKCWGLALSSGPSPSPCILFLFLQNYVHQQTVPKAYEKELKDIVERDPLHPVFEQDKELVWRFRYIGLCTYP